MDDDRDMNSAGEPGKEAPELYALVRRAGGYRLTRKEFLKAAAGVGAGMALGGRGVGPTARAADGKSASRPTSGRVLFDLGAAPDALKKAAVCAHADSVNSLAFSPDGKLLASGSDGERLASGSDDNTVKLWDVSTGTCARTLKGHGEDVLAVAFSPDGKTLASGSYYQTVKLWDVPTGKSARTLKGHVSAVQGVAFSPDGKRLASGSHDGTVKLWDVSTGRCAWTHDENMTRLYSLAFSPGGKLLASASENNTVKLWDVSTGNCWLRGAGTTRSSCGASQREPALGRSKDTRRRSTRWPSAPTASCWPRETRRALSSCGT